MTVHPIYAMGFAASRTSSSTVTSPSSPFYRGCKRGDAAGTASPQSHIDYSRLRYVIEINASHRSHRHRGRHTARIRPQDSV